MVFNTDQSGFNYELHSVRTLSKIGQTTTTLLYKSLHSKSCSYIILFVITRSGHLLYKFLICLQENTTVFGNRIVKVIPNFQNVLIKFSKSGKMTKDLVIEFNNEVIK